MVDRVLVLMNWNPATEEVTISVSGKSFPFDPRTSLQIHRKIFPYCREMAGADEEAKLLRAAANLVITPLPAEPGE